MSDKRLRIDPAIGDEIDVRMASAEERRVLGLRDPAVVLTLTCADGRKAVYAADRTIIGKPSAAGGRP
jgi:hypothetical protein